MLASDERHVPEHQKARAVTRGKSQLAKLRAGFRNPAKNRIDSQRINVTGAWAGLPRRASAATAAARRKARRYAAADALWPPSDVRTRLEQRCALALSLGAGRASTAPRTRRTRLRYSASERMETLKQQH